MLPRPLLQRTVLLRPAPSNTPSARCLSLARTLFSTPTLGAPAHGQSLLPCRHLSVSLARRNVVAEAPAASASSTTSTTTPTENANKPVTEDVYNKVYVGPLKSTFRRLKVFSLASLTLSTTLAPFMFVIESNLPPTARLALASIAITTSATSTAMVAWCGKPYVTQLKYIRPEQNGGTEGMEMTTVSLMMKSRITRVYDPSFLVETRRAFAKWELAQKVILPKGDESMRLATPGQEETIAETRDEDGKPLGRWVVTWGKDGEGMCREIGNVVRYFNVHEELLP